VCVYIFIGTRWRVFYGRFSFGSSRLINTADERLIRKFVPGPTPLYIYIYVGDVPPYTGWWPFEIDRKDVSRSSTVGTRNKTTTKLRDRGLIVRIREHA